MLAAAVSQGNVICDGHLTVLSLQATTVNGYTLVTHFESVQMSLDTRVDHCRSPVRY